MSLNLTETIGGGPGISPGIVPGYVDIIIVVSVFTALSTLAVGLRFWSRKLCNSIWWDDWVSLTALIFVYGYFITTILLSTIGHAGHHLVEYTYKQLELYSQIELANDIIYNCSLCASDMALLLFYYRIFAVKSVRIQLYLCGALIIGYFFAAEFGLIFSTDPVYAQWKFWVPHSTIHQMAFWISCAIIHLVIDVVILWIPIPQVWKLQLSTKRKILLSILFLVGVFTCVSSILRIYYVSVINMSDATYSSTIGDIFTCLELNLSIICGCAPALPMLFRFYNKKASVEPAKANTEKLNQTSFPSRNASWNSTWSRILRKTRGSRASSTPSDKASIPSTGNTTPAMAAQAVTGGEPISPARLDSPA